MFNTAQIIRTCISLGIPCMFENPSTSLMWKAPPVHRASLSMFCHDFVFDQCQFGTRWRKRTRILAWHCCSCDSLERKCSGHKGICSRSRKPHIVLSGSCKGSGKLWTAIAQEYPSKLCDVIAATLAASSNASRIKNRLKICGC